MKRNRLVAGGMLIAFSAGIGVGYLLGTWPTTPAEPPAPITSSVRTRAAPRRSPERIPLPNTTRPDFEALYRRSQKKLAMRNRQSQDDERLNNLVTDTLYENGYVCEGISPLQIGRAAVTILQIKDRRVEPGKWAYLTPILNREWSALPRTILAIDEDGDRRITRSELLRTNERIKQSGRVY